jgi:hypothetical protein
MATRIELKSLCSSRSADRRPSACRFVQVEDEKGVSSRRLQALGWKCRTVEETLRDTVDSYKAAGIMN